ncbi:glycoside hydrolase superfamily [Dioszegia hungarica]|uniref:Glycoside hydrolase superfamily n=1 Tax=Dioszegia hungarica TaxID=4972 RepID=A0AA38H7D2_9TREE|nr:glycoside hydrolase superfamily [Dioszegia hungarica]KAI9635807.1 glycoside hydrolase superfamily [Dioszegia hungarica]
MLSRLLPFLLATTTAILAQTDRAKYLASGDTIRGVNLGGWLLTERWITPSVYRGTGAYDEWHLCASLGRSSCRSLLERHWDSFYTYDDLADIKAAGLNSLRIPVGYWAVDLADYEPYTNGQYPYLVRLILWAKMLGLSASIDLHGLPGSQNGQDNSGLTGGVYFAANSSNTDRGLQVLGNLSREFSGDQYGGVVKSIELMNEPRIGGSSSFSMDQLKAFYTAGIKTVRDSSGGKLSATIHDAFYGPSYWRYYDPTSTTASSPVNYVAIDTHQYYAFPPLQNLTQSVILQSVCNISKILKGTSGIPRINVGEWSLETGNAHETTSTTYANSQEKRTWLRKLFEAQLAAYTPNGPNQPSGGWYYWTWKTENDIDTWSYRRGVWDGYIPKDVSNASTLAFPLRSDGCIDDTFAYQAPSRPGSARAARRWIGWAGTTAVGLAVAAICVM